VTCEFCDKPLPYGSHTVRGWIVCDNEFCRATAEQTAPLGEVCRNAWAWYWAQRLPSKLLDKWGMTP
jgi:hypothetical protein